MNFLVWGRIDGVAFRQVFASVAEWRAEKALLGRHAVVEVLGMSSVEVAV